MRSVVMILWAALLLAGCGYKEGVVSGDSKAYLYFSGDASDVTIVIDDGMPFRVEAGRDHRYYVQPGKHTLRIFRDETLRAERTILLDDGVMREIVLP